MEAFQIFCPHLLKGFVREDIAADHVENGDHREARPEDTDKRPLNEVSLVSDPIAVEKGGAEVVGEMLVEDEETCQASKTVEGSDAVGFAGFRCSRIS